MKNKCSHLTKSGPRAQILLFTWKQCFKPDTRGRRITCQLLCQQVTKFCPVVGQRLLFSSSVVRYSQETGALSTITNSKQVLVAIQVQMTSHKLRHKVLPKNPLRRFTLPLNTNRERIGCPLGGRVVILHLYRLHS